MTPVRTSAGTPVIGIVTCGFAGNRQFVTDSYISSVCRGGGCPVLLPCVENGNRRLMEVMASCCHGFLFCGGGDITPFLLDRPPLSPSGETDIKTDIFQILFLKYVLSTSKPVLAICRGMQVLNAAGGGELLQDLSLREEPVLNHMQRSRLRSDFCHTISVKKDSILYKIFGETTAVNSFHHQAVLTPGEGLTVTARAPDGIPEGLEMPSHPFVLGVQWHPECMTRSLNMRRLFLAFVDAARGQDGREGR